MKIPQIVLWGSLCLIAVPLANLNAQDETGGSSVEGRLLEILKARGLLSESEFEELRGLEAELRRKDALNKDLEEEIDRMVLHVADEAPKTGYKPGKGFQWNTTDGKFALTLGGRIQVRFTYEENTDEVSGSKFDEGEPNFDVPRTRIWFEGHAFEPWWRYHVQFDVAGDVPRGTVALSNVAGGSATFSSGTRLVELKDAFIEFTKWKPFNLRMGQFKVPYSRHQMTSSGRQQFVDRAITDRAFAPGRDHGLLFFGSVGGEKEDLFEYAFGMFDGEGENNVNNDDGLFYSGRMVVNPMGGIPYSESNFASGDAFKLALGINAYFHDNDNHSQTGSRFDVWSAGADLTMTFSSFYATGEIHHREDEQSGDDVETFGWMAQLGYFFVPGEFEVAVRAANVDANDPNTSFPRTAEREYLVVLGWFLNEHSLKFQSDFGRVELHQLNSDRDDDEWRFRLQAQIIF